MNLKPKSLKKIDSLIPRYPEKRSAVLPVLHVIQEEAGYISNEAIEWVAERLDLEPVNVYELVTFYPMLRQKPAGKQHVKVCRTLSCALRGAYGLCENLQRELNCPLGETSEDGEYTIEFVECLASCGTAPVVQVNEVLHENITPEKAKEFAEALKKKKLKKVS